MNRRAAILFGLTCALFSGFTPAGEKQDPNGTWKWSVTRDDKLVVNLSVKLKYEGEKLTGKITLPNKKQIDIEDASFKDGEVAFTVTQDGGGNRKAVSKYKGKLEGDAIKGTTETTFTPSNRNETNDWEPTREKP